MRLTKLTALTATAALAVSAAAPAAGLAKATGPGKHEVSVEDVYVTKKPGKGFTGTLFEGQTFKVKRLSPSGRYAYGMAYGHVNRHGWVLAAALDDAR